MTVLLGVMSQAAAAGLALPVRAHDGAATAISLSAERLPPGGALEIIGTDFDPGETLEIRLAGPVGNWILPNVTTGPDGHFAVVRSVPGDATPGLYTLDAISTTGIIQRETLQVDPAAPAPALTPSPAGPSGPSEAVDLGGAAWMLAPLAVLGFITALFVASIRRRPREPAVRRQSSDSGDAKGR